MLRGTKRRRRRISSENPFGHRHNYLTLRLSAVSIGRGSRRFRAFRAVSGSRPIGTRGILDRFQLAAAGLALLLEPLAIERFQPGLPVAPPGAGILGRLVQPFL